MGEKMVSTLGDFIYEEMVARDMSAREFAAFLGVPHATVNKFLNYGKTESYAGRPIGKPSVEFIEKLSEKTGIDICTVMELITGKTTNIRARARLLAERIERMPAEDQEIIDRYILGTGLKSDK